MIPTARTAMLRTKEMIERMVGMLSFSSSSSAAVAIVPIPAIVGAVGAPSCWVLYSCTVACGRGCVPPAPPIGPVAVGEARGTVEGPPGVAGAGAVLRAIVGAGAGADGADGAAGAPAVFKGIVGAGGAGAPADGAGGGVGAAL